MTVFKEEDLNRMKQQALSGGNADNMMLADMLLMNHEATEEHKQTAGDTSSRVKATLKSGFGSILGIFGEHKSPDKKKELAKGDKKIMDFDPPSSRSSISSMSSFSIDASQFGSQISSIDYQSRYAFFTHFK